MPPRRYLPDPGRTSTIPRISSAGSASRTAILPTPKDAASWRSAGSRVPTETSPREICEKPLGNLGHRGAFVYGSQRCADFDDWTTLAGSLVEFHHQGRLLDAGTVEAVTPDGEVLWLSLEGPLPRRIIQMDPNVFVSAMVEK